MGQVLAHGARFPLAGRARGHTESNAVKRNKLAACCVNAVSPVQSCVLDPFFLEKFEEILPQEPFRKD